MMWMLKARFIRWCHLMAQFGRLDPHQGDTFSVGFKTVAVECSCGRVFEADPEHQGDVDRLKTAIAQAPWR